jgi:hypothetical protein
MTTIKEISSQEYFAGLTEFAALALRIAAIENPEARIEAEQASKRILAVLEGTTGGVATLAVAGIAVAIARQQRKFSEEFDRANRGQVA